jgi:hypothetical protein
MTDILSLRESQDHLNSLIPPKYQSLRASLTHSELESAFRERLFIVYRANGRGKPPTILAWLKVKGCGLTPESGFGASIQNLETGEMLGVGHTPERLFGYDLFMQVPSEMSIRWTGKRHQGYLNFTLLFALIIIMRNRSETCTPGAVYCLTPNRFKKLYPNVSVDLNR